MGRKVSVTFSGARTEMGGDGVGEIMAGIRKEETGIRHHKVSGATAIVIVMHSASVYQTLGGNLPQDEAGMAKPQAGEELRIGHGMRPHQGFHEVGVPRMMVF